MGKTKWKKDLPRSRKSLPIAMEVARRLKRAIIDGSYRPHSFLPSERQLAQSLNTSRVTVSSALRELEREGLVLRTPSRGTRVLPALDRLSQPRIGIIHGEFCSMDEVGRQDSLRTLQGLRETLDRLGYTYSTVSVPLPNSLTPDELVKDLGAVVLIEGSYADRDQLNELERRKIPLVVAKLECDVDVSATWVDHEKSMRQAVNTFANLGHERIAFVGREASYGIHGKARAGYLAGLREVGLSIDETLVAVCEKTDALSGYFAARGLLQLPIPPTAIICARDSIAEGVCRSIEEAGLTLGQDVSVIGFDNTTWPEGREILTTFGEPCHEMGAAAAEMLVERIVSGWRPPEKREFEATFILRRTAGPLIRTGRVPNLPNASGRSQSSPVEE